MMIFKTRKMVMGATLICLASPMALWIAPSSAQEAAAPAPAKRGKGKGKGAQKKGGNRAKAQNAAGGQAPAAQDGFFEQVIGEEAPKPGVAPQLTTLPVAALRGLTAKTTSYPVPAGAIFVSPTGNGSGAATSPTSLEKAIAHAPAGATIVLRGGDYRGVMLELPRRLTLQAYPGEKPVLKGSEVVTDWTRQGNAWRHGGWTYEFPLNAAPEHLDPKYPLAALRDMLFVDGDPLVQVGKREDVGPGRFWVDYAGDALVMGNDPAGKTVEATNRAYGILIKQKFPVEAGDASNPSGSQIRGLSFLHFAEMGLGIAAESVTVEDSLFKWNGFQGLGMGPHVDSSPQLPRPQGNGPKNCVVRGNTFAGNGERGVIVHGGNNLRFEGNRVAYNNVEHFRGAWGAAGIKIARTQGMILRDNLIEENQSAGVWMDISVTQCQITGNTVRNNAGLGIFTELSHDILVAFNLCVGNNVGMMIADSSKIRVLNNTLVDNKTGVLVKDSPRLNKDEKQIAAGIAWIARDNVIQNNVIAATRPDARLLSAAESWANSSSGEMIAVLDNNLYIAPTGTTNLLRWSPAKGQQGIYHASLGAFQAATGRETGGASRVLTAKEAFVNAPGGDFRLRPGLAIVGQSLAPDVAKSVGKAPGATGIGAF